MCFHLKFHLSVNEFLSFYGKKLGFREKKNLNGIIFHPMLHARKYKSKTNLKPRTNEIKLENNKMNKSNTEDQPALEINP